MLYCLCSRGVLHPYFRTFPTSLKQSGATIAAVADPLIISGGMGVWISNWKLARIVSMMGGLGTVSGTALDVVYLRLLQQGDPGGHVRRAFGELASRYSGLAEGVQNLISRYYIQGGKNRQRPFLGAPSGQLNRLPSKPGNTASLWEPERDFQTLTIAANFAEVWLAKEGHGGSVGINFLRKIERPLPYALLGALLAGADYVAVGAGNPAEIPGMIRSLCRLEDTCLPLKVSGAHSADGEFAVCASPRTLLGPEAAPLPVPKTLAIVSSFQLAEALASSQEARPYGFILESSAAGGHNAAPAMKAFNEQREPVIVYTERDRIDVKAIAALGLPFWLAGNYGTPQGLRQALALGASGVQFGTPAALSLQSGLEPALRLQALELLRKGELKVSTEGRVSPSGFPFKVAQLPGTLSDPEVFNSRRRLCDIGYLQSAYLCPGGGVGFRCPAESVEAYVGKGGKAEHTVGRVCLCNALVSSAGFASLWADGYVEPPIVTLGEELGSVSELLKTLPAGQDSYSIGKALHYIASGLCS